MAHYKSKDKDAPLSTSEVRLLVKKQAMRHTRRLKNNPLFNIQRPNEPDLILQYRNAMARMLSKDGFDRWCSKVGRIIETAGLTIDRTTLNEATREWLEEENFQYMGQYSGVQEWFLRIIVPGCVEDPNGLIVVFPYNPESPQTPLPRPVTDGGLPNNTAPAIDVQTIPTEDIIETGTEYFSYWGWETEIRYGTDTKKERVWFEWDANYVYINWPMYDEKLQLVYVTEVWYQHDFGFLPLNFMPGRIAKSETGEYYNESFLHPYFEYADEFASAFSDVQANRVSHLYPKVIMTEMPCPEKGCKSGRIKYTDKAGIEKIAECQTCGGSGVIKDPGPYGVILQKAQGGIDGQSGQPNPYQYVTPPTEVFALAWEKTFELLERGKRAVGLDLLLNLNESGVAMEHRLEDLEDMLKDFGGTLIDTMEVVLECVDALLHINPAQRKAPKIVRPKRYDIKTALGHKMDYDNALPFDRYNAAIQLIQNKYRGDDVKQKVYREAFKFAPELLLSEQEFSVRVASGVYQTQNVTKRDNVVMLITQLADELGDDRYLATDYEAVTAYLIPAIAALTPQSQPTGLFDNDGNPI